MDTGRATLHKEISNLREQLAAAQADVRRLTEWLPELLKWHHAVAHVESWQSASCRLCESLGAALARPGVMAAMKESTNAKQD